MIIVGPEKKEFKILAEKMGLIDKVFFEGLVGYDKFKKYLFASDVLLLPRSNRHLLDRCTFPGRIGDYMLSGRPIVASSVGELPSFFGENDIGSLAESDDYNDFAKKILFLLDNEDIAEEMSKKAFEVGKNKYGWDIMTESLLKNVYLF